jgi:secreted protein with Ig-like and vWFA domain
LIVIGSFFSIPTEILREKEVIFVVGASGASSTRIFEMCRQVMNKVIEGESLPRVRYGVVLYGQDAYTGVNLDDFSDKSKLIGFISQITQPQAGQNYEKGILKALEIFTEQGSPNAERAIILLTNSKSNASPTEMAAIKNQLSQTRTRLIVVNIDGVGENVRDVAPNDEDIVPVSSRDYPDRITKDVTNVIVKGKFQNFPHC